MVEVGDGHRFQLKAVLLEGDARVFFHAVDVVAATLVHFLHGHFGGNRAQRGHQFARQQRIEFGNIQGAPAECGGGRGHRLARRRYADVKLGFNVDAHTILGDQRIVAVAHDLHAQHVHVDRGHFMNEGKDERAPVDDHLFAEQTGTDEG